MLNMRIAPARHEWSDAMALDSRIAAHVRDAAEQNRRVNIAEKASKALSSNLG